MHAKRLENCKAVFATSLLCKQRYSKYQTYLYFKIIIFKLCAHVGVHARSMQVW